MSEIIVKQTSEVSKTSAPVLPEDADKKLDFTDWSVPELLLIKRDRRLLSLNLEYLISDDFQALLLMTSEE